MHESQVRNIVQAEIIEMEAKRKKMGCETMLGCIKGKEHDAFINGTYQSDKNDIREFIARQDKLNDKMGAKLTEVMISLKEILIRVENAIKGNTENALKIKDNQSMIRATDARIWVFFSAISLMLVGSVITGVVTALKINNDIGSKVQKINSVDIENQKNTEALMVLLGTYLSGKNSDQVLSDVQKKVVESQKR